MTSIEQQLSGTPSRPRTMDELAEQRRSEDDARRAGLDRDGLDALLRLDLRNPVNRGRLAAARERVPASGPEARLIDTLLEQASRLAADAQLPTIVAPNPVRVMPAPNTRRPDGTVTAERPLQATDIEYIRRLPLDADKITETDVRELVAMTGRTSDPSDRRLLASVLEPVRQMHDRRIERETLQRTVDASPPVPVADLVARNVPLRELVVEVAGEVLGREVSELTDGEVRVRAIEFAAVPRADVLTAHAERVDAAKQRLIELGGEGS